MYQEELVEQATVSLKAALQEYPANAGDLLEAIRAGKIDGTQSNAVLGFLSKEDRIVAVASGQQHPGDLPAVESFVLGITEGDSVENCEPLAILEDIVDEFINTISQHEEGYASQEW